MALVTLQRSPTPSAASSASTGELEVGSDEDRKLNLSLSESFFMVKGAALFLQQGNSPQGHRGLQHPHKPAGDLPQHLQVMINLLRCEDRIKLAVRLESAWADRVRYMVVVYSSGRQDTEENVLLGVDFSSKECKSCTIGMVLRLWSDTKIHLDGDGGFSVSTAGRMHIFKPVSVQAMWSALQVLHKACEVARRHNYFPGGLALIWATYYESCVGSDQSCINEWNAMPDLESTRPDSPALFVDKPTEGERTERLIKAKLRSIMMSQDLENVTSKEIRNELEKQMNCNLKEFKEFIDNEMLLILGQMDKPSLIFDHLYLGSEWNASNLEELQGSGVDYILNVTREIDNFFPGLFAYHNIRVYDEETTDLLAHWNEAYHFINKAKKNHSKCLVHCKMGVSRSASTVIAYAMKEFGWPLERAYSHVKEKRGIARPNAGFMRQLSEYEGILDASKQRHNKLWQQQAHSHLPTAGRFHPSGPGDFLLDSLDVDLESSLVGLGDPQAPRGRPFPPCFRRLSDPGACNALFHLDDLERDALLEEDEEEEDGAGRTALVSEPAGPRLEDSGEEEGEKGVPTAFGEEMERDEVPGPLGEASRPNLENLNNNNSKRSCPDDFENDAIFGILSKVRPSYQSCADCMYSSARTTSEAFGEPRESFGAPAICTQPPLLPHLPPAPPSRDLGLRGPRTLARLNASPPSPGPDPGRWEPPERIEETPKGPRRLLPKILPLEKNSQPAKGPPGLEAAWEEPPPPKKDVRLPRDPRVQLFSQELAKSNSTSYLMQHQESLIQLQKAGLVRKHTKELERLKGTPAEAAAPSVPDQGCPWPPGLAGTPPQDGSPQKLNAPARADLSGSLTRDFLKTICSTPPSSSRSSNLTRSSSSDSIHSVHGKPGLVKQRTQEIETRLRLAGLTVSSPLKRSHSLAKLGSLDFSSEDLAGEADAAGGRRGEPSLLPEPRPLVGPASGPVSPLGNLESAPWPGKS
ncbi:LOW QUALITY PROTEIN: protein phosphatase Slingshot homolog 1 [Tachyglossus aculeatus]|uniref:LOW QUALITY PROTEIN: protein phosphatase Slingshot homolog 1 n=1 Tax=Tachyglossus aculeatus TaxID=9261 RepID=UPI0018F29CD2|nr:LOW QUALITY PROTEIN: protein phosphatase Slingshot homolog 1 [Tachyglossus aculeatus]